MNIREQEFGKSMVVSLGQKFPLFSDVTQDLGGREVQDLENYYVENQYLYYRTPIILDLEKLEIPFYGDFIGLRDISVAETLTPFNPHLGYKITAEDFDPYTRANKLLSNVSRYKQHLGYRPSLLRFEMSGISNERKVLEQSDLENGVDIRRRLRLIIDAPGGKLVSISDSPDIRMQKFTPADFPGVADLLPVIREREERHLDYHPRTMFLRSMSYIKAFYLAVPFPYDPKKMGTMTGEFFMQS